MICSINENILLMSLPMHDEYIARLQDSRHAMGADRIIYFLRLKIKVKNSLHMLVSYQKFLYLDEIFISLYKEK